MRVLIACEFSGVVRDAFTARGHEAMSCDLYESWTPGPHYTGDVRDVILGHWDLMIAHPPCTYLASSGSRWWWDDDGLNEERLQLQQEALAFVRLLLRAPIDKIALENPVGKIGTAIRPADQYVQPYEYGHPSVKKTGLWLKNLPPLVPTNIVEGRRDDTSNITYDDSEKRSAIRSITYRGIAEAMADQWGGTVLDQPQPDDQLLPRLQSTQG